MGEYGAEAVRQKLFDDGVHDVPSVRTIARVFERTGLLDAKKRLRRPPPPIGWYLPDVAAGQAEVDSFDFITGLAIRQSTHFEVFNAVSLLGGVVGSWPRTSAGSHDAAMCAVSHWIDVGLPGYAQFDNDARFIGPKQYTGVLGIMTRTCLSLGVVPVFAPPKETGFQAAIESFNARWQSKIWNRQEFRDFGTLVRRTNAYVAAHRSRGAQRRERAARRVFPTDWAPDFTTPPSGRVVYLRRTDDRGRAEVLGYKLHVDRFWVHRLVRAEVDVAARRIRFFALRRRAPTEQPQLGEREFELRKPRQPARSQEVFAKLAKRLSQIR